ncbi:hypothetical protein Angca_006773 [Angiostrongylus cantonensis]|nr:hypothetical protein Angca_006773 [Angiostrongylus cantonensis]
MLFNLVFMKLLLLKVLMVLSTPVSSLLFSSVILCQEVLGRGLTREEWDTLQTTYVLPNSVVFLHSLVFMILLALLLYPPDAFVGAGLSFDSLAYGYLGSPVSNILEFHCRRVVLTRTLIASSPYLLVLSLYFANEHAVLFTSHPTRAIHYIAILSPFFAAGGVAYLVYHTMTGFRALPVMRKLNKYGYDTHQVFTILSSEFSHVGAFRHVISNVSVLIVTDSWLFHCSRFHFVVVKLPDAHFCVVNAVDTMNMLHHALGMNQYLTVAVSLPADIEHLNFEFKCVSCMARIFLSKQDQSRPNVWLEGTCSCPTCRATFCIMDVALLSYVDEEDNNDDSVRNSEE